MLLPISPFPFSLRLRLQPLKTAAHIYGGSSHLNIPDPDTPSGAALRFDSVVMVSPTKLTYLNDVLCTKGLSFQYTNVKRCR